MKVYIHDPDRKLASRHAAISDLNYFGLGLTLVNDSSNADFYITPEDINQQKKLVKFIMGKLQKRGRKAKPKSQKAIRDTYAILDIPFPEK